MNHPCFKQLWANWRAHGEYRIDRYSQEYEIDGRHGTDFHRTLSAYLNEVIRSGCRIREIAEPALDPRIASAADTHGIDAYAHLPNFLVVAAER